MRTMRREVPAVVDLAQRATGRMDRTRRLKGDQEQLEGEVRMAEGMDVRHSAYAVLSRPVLS